MIIFSIVIWCILGYVGGWLFAQKGYPPKIGIVIGVVFGPCMLAICLLLPKTREGVLQEQLEREIDLENVHQNQTKRCPECDRELGFSARICPRCGFRFEVPTA